MKVFGEVSFRNDEKINPDFCSHCKQELHDFNTTLEMAVAFKDL